jgi:hypothetical protein
MTNQEKTRRRLLEHTLATSFTPIKMTGRGRKRTAGTTTTEPAELSANALCNRLWHGGAL